MKFATEDVLLQYFLLLLWYFLLLRCWIQSCETSSSSGYWLQRFIDDIWPLKLWVLKLFDALFELFLSLSQLLCSHLIWVSFVSRSVRPSVRPFARLFEISLIRVILNVRVYFECSSLFWMFELSLIRDLACSRSCSRSLHPYSFFQKIHACSRSRLFEISLIRVYFECSSLFWMFEFILNVRVYSLITAW